MKYTKENVLDYKFGSNDNFNLEELRTYIIDFCEYDNMLDKRISNAFNRNKFLYNVVSKEDFKQDIILHLLENMTFKIPFMDKQGKLMLFNNVVTRKLGKLVHKCYKAFTIPLDDDFIVSSPDLESKATIEDIMCLFANESIEKKIIELYNQGFIDKEIIEKLDVSKMTFYKYKKKIKNTLMEKDYGWN